MKKVTENETTLGEYTYDVLGRRVKKVAGGTTTIYIYDQRGFLIEEADSQGTWQKDYVYLNRQPLAMIVNQGEDKAVYYHHNDHLGTPQILTDSIGTVIWEASYQLETWVI